MAGMIKTIPFVINVTIDAYNVLHLLQTVLNVLIQLEKMPQHVHVWLDSLKTEYPNVLNVIICA